MGNIASVQNMIRHIGGSAHISSSPEEVINAKMLILPGVGSFDAGVTALREKKLDQAIIEAVNENAASILGICLGMQMLMESSEEGQLPGLSLIPGRVRRFQVRDKGLRIPHMGWNYVKPNHPCILFDPEVLRHRFYFVHSYHVDCSNPEDIAGTTQYGYSFPSAIAHDQVFGVQFHPEKSHAYGMRLLKRFIEDKP